MVKENPDVTSPTDPRTVKERQFVTGYLDETPTSAKAIKLRRMIIDGSRRALEKQ